MGSLRPGPNFCPFPLPAPWHGGCFRALPGERPARQRRLGVAAAAWARPRAAPGLGKALTSCDIKHGGRQKDVPSKVSVS